MNAQILRRWVSLVILGLSVSGCQSPPGSADWEALAKQFDTDVVHIPAGEFVMGSDNARSDERPQHQVYLDAFELDRFEVTNAQYRRFVIATHRAPPRYWSEIDFPSGQARYPVVGVSWDDADAYCAWVNKRLPTEAEWEKACRGAAGRVYPWGDDWVPRRANVDVTTRAPQTGDQVWETAWNSLRTSAASPGLKPVGAFPEGASPYGAMDLVGNASEWTADWYNWSDYAAMPSRNPRGLGPPWNRNLRGSAWYDPQGARGWAQDLSRCSARNSSHEIADPRVGFRCARAIE